MSKRASLSEEEGEDGDYISGSDTEVQPETNESFYDDAELQRDVIEVPAEPDGAGRYTKSFLWGLRNEKKQLPLQQRLREKWRQKAKTLAEVHHEVFDPDSAESCNLNTDEICMEEEPNPGVYAATLKKSTKSKRAEIKLGRSVDMPDRHAQSYEGKEAVVVFNRGLAGDGAMKVLKESIEETANMRGVSLEGVDVDNLTVKQVAGFEEEGGLPTEARLLFNSFVSQNKRLRGADELSGVRDAFELNIAEGGIGEYFEKDRGVNIAVGTNPCEHIVCNNISWAETARRLDEAALNEFWAATADLVGWEWLAALQYIVMKSSWEPNLPNPERGATRKIHDALWNEKDSIGAGRWGNIFGDKKPKIPGEPYNAKDGFNDTEREEARKELLAALVELIKRGGWGLFDVASEAFRNTGTTIFGLMKEAGYPAEPFYEYLHLKAFYLERGGKKSVVVVFNPLCDIFQSGGGGKGSGKGSGEGGGKSRRSNTQSGTTRGATVMNTQAEKARTANVLQGLIWELKEPRGERTLEVNSSYWQNFLTAYGMRVFGRKRLHLNLMRASQIGKWALNYPFDNLLLKANHGMPSSERGRNIRQRRRKMSASEAKDRRFHYRAMNCISLSTSDEDLHVHINAAVDQHVNHQQGFAGRTGERSISDRNRAIQRFETAFLRKTRGGRRLAGMIDDRLKHLDQPRKTESRQRQQQQNSERTTKRKRMRNAIDSDVEEQGSDGDVGPDDGPRKSWANGEVKGEVGRSKYGKYGGKQPGSFGPPQHVEKQYERYLAEGYRDKWFENAPWLDEYLGVGNDLKYGLYMTCMVLFDLRKKETKEFLDCWWKENIVGSTQDQVGFPYCAWKLNTRIHALPDKEAPTRWDPTNREADTNPYFRKLEHGL